jgi:hypothetical protein
MGLPLKIINPQDYGQWDDLLISTPDYSFFHSSSWANVLTESYNYVPCYVTQLDNNKLHSLLPIMEVKSFLTKKRGVSLPFTDYCEPIVSDGVLFHELMGFVTAYGEKRGWKHFEVRGGQAFLGKETPSACYFDHTLDLTIGIGKILAGLRESTKRNLKKAQREDIEVGIFTTLESVNRFYHLNCMTRKRHGLPPQPYRFFRSIHQNVISRGFGLVVLAFYRQTCIAGAVFFHFGGKVLFKYGASNLNYQHLRANNLVMWEAIKWYSQNGYKSLCFGRTEPQNDGLRQFKRGWGARERIVNYYKYDFSRGAFIAGQSAPNKLYNRLLSKMPIPALRLIGTLLCKYIG